MLDCPELKRGEERWLLLFLSCLSERFPYWAARVSSIFLASTPSNFSNFFLASTLQDLTLLRLLPRVV